MSEDLTKKLANGDIETRILTTVQNIETLFRSSLDQLVSWVSSIDARLKHLEQRVEERLHDTRPIWHKVVADIGDLQSSQKRFEQGQDGLRAEIRELNNSVRTVSRDQIVINDGLRRIQVDLHNFDERLHTCETKRRAPNSST
jgi:septal ring factor EnvC (AmiA/AmiB activator)